MKRKTSLFLMLMAFGAALVLAFPLSGCNKTPEDAGAPTPPPAMTMNGQSVPSEGAHYMQQMRQGQNAPNAGR
jgi:hypothetical protein